MARAIHPGFAPVATEEDARQEERTLMQRRITLAMAIAAAALAGAVLSTGTATAGGGATIKVDDDFFSPNKKTVSSGTAVKFKWVGSNAHNVTKQSGPGGSFQSETTDDKGVNFTKKFKKAGTYKLVCTIHQGMDMKLKVN
jgi:plastocyanin